MGQALKKIKKEGLQWKQGTKFTALQKIRTKEF